jgi:hypothetical protein
VTVAEFLRDFPGQQYSALFPPKPITENKRLNRVLHIPPAYKVKPVNSMTYSENGEKAVVCAAHAAAITSR